MHKKDQEVIDSLNQWGVPFLSGSPVRGTTQTPLDAKELIANLIRSDLPRFKLGVTAFFLVHPEMSEVVHQSLSLLDVAPHKLLKYYYTAAVYLQRYWKSQLSLYSAVLLPDYFSNELKLPDPVVLHGKWGLAVLEEALQRMFHTPYNYLASFEALARLLQQQGGSHEAAGLV